MVKDLGEEGRRIATEQQGRRERKARTQTYGGSKETSRYREAEDVERERGGEGRKGSRERNLYR